MLTYESPGLVVIRVDSSREDRGFESVYWMDIFSHICCKNCKVCLNRPKIYDKDTGIGPFLNKLIALW